MATFADEEAKPKMTAADRLAKLGGYVVYPNSQKGSIAFIDTQKAVDASSDIEEVLGYFRHQVPVKIDYIKADAGEPKTLKSNAKANFAVVFISDNAQPPSVIVPEEGYAVVNFAKYTTGLKLPTDDAKYKRRCARSALKAFVLLCGGGSSRYPGHVASAQTPQELDFAQDKLPIDIQDSVKKYLGAAGVTPMKRTIYQRACQEGWAPQPTNDAQRVIWNQVHQIPDKPITIEFDPKKDK
jgi:hypothetical protein